MFVWVGKEIVVGIGIMDPGFTVGTFVVIGNASYSSARWLVQGMENVWTTSLQTSDFIP